MPLNILIVKLSSLGDVVHAMPAVQDIRRALPQARITWVVEQGFAPLAARCEGVASIIPCELRRWRKAPLSAATRQAWRAFRGQLQAQAYDAIIDLQGLTKSALVARLARTTPTGRRYALANQTEGSSYEAPTRWVADVAVRVAPHIHAVQRSRILCAQALGYELQGADEYGLIAHAQASNGIGINISTKTSNTSNTSGSSSSSASTFDATPAACRNADGTSGEVALIHGTSREDKLWPEAHWLALGQRLIAQGHTLGLPHGSDAEKARAERIAQALCAAGPHTSGAAPAHVWQRLPLDQLADRLAACAGAIGVDSGLSHIATALDLPHVQIYNFDTAWRTGPVERLRQRSVFEQPTPTVEAVWHAWLSASLPLPLGEGRGEGATPQDQSEMPSA